jgi:hypothetical protein
MTMEASVAFGQGRFVLKIPVDEMSLKYIFISVNITLRGEAGENEA